nr:hypothetical protein [Mycolicibacterium goodii]
MTNQRSRGEKRGVNHTCGFRHGLTSRIIELIGHLRPHAGRLCIKQRRNRTPAGKRFEHCPLPLIRRYTGLQLCDHPRRGDRPPRQPHPTARTLTRF